MVPAIIKYKMSSASEIMWAPPSSIELVAGLSRLCDVGGVPCIRPAVVATYYKLQKAPAGHACSLQLQNCKASSKACPQMNWGVQRIDVGSTQLHGAGLMLF
jgi:hypothetical protein